MSAGQEARPNLMLVILPESAAQVYRDVKRFGDVTVGVVTQCVVGYTLIL
jgi:eukaryotic translation initiation factor 2C